MTHACTRPAAHAAHTWRETGGARRTFACPGAAALPVTGTIRLRPEAFSHSALHSYGWASARAAAQAVGVAPSTLRRAIGGQIAPGERLIAALLLGTGRTFEALFTVQPDDRVGGSILR